MDSQTFPASYDLAIKVRWGILGAIPLFLGFLVFNFYFLVVFAAICALVLAFAPRSYTVAADSVRVNRWIGPNRIPLGAADRRAQRVTPEILAGSPHVLGPQSSTAGFGEIYWGELGLCVWHGTQRRNHVMVASGRRLWVFTPDDPDGLLDALQAAPLNLELKPPRSEAKWIQVLAALLGLAAIGLVAFALLHTPWPTK